ncbi:pentatricopeptide repeat-containing protein At2g33680 isoform X2 [Mercurialis annua]|uniref:pentatricopeptide repeat-containing protein At2g33680 isoform X2 n=1 Tax=Mercurialis annua TaxID=3986 RepID=UPI00215DE461|nr:pentatricopeptide repeat-containing protein At2g33680 isoform X2 [Mercurialis annua]
MHLSSQNRSFYNCLVQFTNRKSLHEGRALHAQIIKTSSTTCIYLANCVVNFYAKCGCLSKAKLVFDRIHNKDVVSWNCLINAYSQQGRTGSSFVMELLQRMRAGNTLPNTHTFSGVFTAASNLPSTFSGEQAHALAVKMSCFYDVFVGSSLLNMYCKAGMMLEARKVFDKMPQRNEVTWATMISGYALQRRASEAFEIFELMRGEVEDLNEFAFTSVLSGLAVPELVDGGKQIHCLAVKNGLLEFVSILNALVTMYAKCGRLDDSVQVFEMSSDKNSITWSAMITGYAQSGDSHKAAKLFSKMHFAGISPSEFTLVGVLNACSDTCAIEEGKQVHCYLLKLGFESQMFIMTALVDMYAKSGCTADARKGFNYLQEPDLVLWTSMIAGHVQNGENEDALSLYCRMQMEGILPNELTMASVLKACSNLAALDQGMQIHARTIKYGLGVEVTIGSALSNMYAKCGSLEEASLVFTRMPERDTISWNAMISGLSQNGNGEEALELFDRMRQEDTKPDDVTFVNVLSACSHMGFVERGWAYFRMMIDDFGIIPKVDHYACMVDVLSRAGKLNEAKEFIETSTTDHGMCLWRILLSACRNYRNYELGAYAGRKMWNESGA